MRRNEKVNTEKKEFVNRCKTGAILNSIIKVNKEEFVALLNELRQEIPEEVTQSQKVISNKESILLDAKDKAEKEILDANLKSNSIKDDAKRKADAIILSARKESEAIMLEANKLKSQLVNENQIMQAAYAESDRIIAYARMDADKIIYEANAEADELRKSSVRYSDELLQSIQEIISGALVDGQNKFSQYLNSLQYYTEEIGKNRQELATSIVPADPNSQEQ